MSCSPGSPVLFYYLHFRLFFFLFPAAVSFSPPLVSGLTMGVGGIAAFSSIALAVFILKKLRKLKGKHYFSPWPPIPLCFTLLPTVYIMTFFGNISAFNIYICFYLITAKKFDLRWVFTSLPTYLHAVYLHLCGMFWLVVGLTCPLCIFFSVTQTLKSHTKYTKVALTVSSRHK